MSLRKLFLNREVVISSFARSPVGSFLGTLSSIPVHKLGGLAILNAIKRSRIEEKNVDEVIIGHVLASGCGQAPARQAALAANIPTSTDVYSVNKVCASGLKAVCLAAQSILLDANKNVVVAAGMESMSNAPFLINNIRKNGLRLGKGELTDPILLDGLIDPYSSFHMGKCAEKTAKELCIARVDQDEYAVESYKRSTDAWKKGVMAKEVFPVHVPNDNKKSGLEPEKITVDKDEEYPKLKLDKIVSLKSVFEKDGTITAGNASKINDGAAAVVLMTNEYAKQHQITPYARILSFADAAVDPIDFPKAPAIAIKKAIELAGVEHIDFYEINEAFSCVALANMKLLNLDFSRVNCHGGAVSLGHPLGMSGCRILMSLINVLMTNDGRIGCAAICNGGGGATAMIIELI